MYVNDHPHARLLQEMYAAFARPDGFDETMAMLGRMTTDDFVVHCGGASPVAGDFAGIDGMVRHVGDFLERTGGTFSIFQESIIADDHWAMVSQRCTAEAAGGKLDQPVAGIWRFASAGVLGEHWELASDPTQWDAFWGRTSSAAQ